MTFKDFLKKKINLFFVFMAFNLFALSVNILGIEGNFKTTSNCNDNKVENSFFTDSKYSKNEDRYQSNFWPFVDFFYHSGDKDNDWCADPYLGFFRFFDYSEFVAYLLLFIAIMYIYWNAVKGNYSKSKYRY